MRNTPSDQNVENLATLGKNSWNTAYFKQAGGKSVKVWQNSTIKRCAAGSGHIKWRTLISAAFPPLDVEGLDEAWNQICGDLPECAFTSLDFQGWKIHTYFSKHFKGLKRGLVAVTVAAPLCRMTCSDLLSYLHLVCVHIRIRKQQVLLRWKKNDLESGYAACTT